MLCWELSCARNVQGKELGCAWGTETGKLPLSIPWDSAPNQAWDRDNKFYWFEVNISLWGLIGGCNFFISWKLCLFLSVTGKDTMTPSLKICQSLLCEGKTLRCFFWFSHLSSWPGTSSLWLWLWKLCCPIVYRVRSKLLKATWQLRHSWDILLVTTAPIVL